MQNRLSLVAGRGALCAATLLAALVHSPKALAQDEPPAVSDPAAEAPAAAEPAAEPAAAEPAPAAPAAAEPAPAAEPEPPKKRRNNVVYLELGGPAIIYSLNYERRIGDFNLRLGAGGAAFSGAGYFIAPIGFNYMGIGGDKHHLELGVTANLGFSGAQAVGTAPGASYFFASFSPIIGYRLQPETGGFTLRAGISPIIGATSSGVAAFGFLPLPYVSFGAAF